MCIYSNLMSTPLKKKQICATPRRYHTEPSFSREACRKDRRIGLPRRKDKPLLFAFERRDQKGGLQKMKEGRKEGRKGKGKDDA